MSIFMMIENKICGSGRINGPLKIIYKGNKSTKRC